MIGIGSKKGNNAGKHRGKERVRTRKGFDAEEIAEETVEELEEANKEAEYEDEFEDEDEDGQEGGSDDNDDEEEGTNDDEQDGESSSMQFGSGDPLSAANLFDDEMEGGSKGGVSPANHRNLTFDSKQGKESVHNQEQSAIKTPDKNDMLKQMKTQKSMRENVPVIPDWMNQGSSKLLSDMSGEMKKMDDKSDVFFDDAEVDFNFVADFSKLLSLVRYLLHTVRKQSKIIKEMESTLDHHATYMDRVIAISDIGPVTQADLGKALLLPDGRTMKEAVITHEESLSKTMDNVIENTHKIMDLESQVSRKAERETVVNVLLYDKLATDYAESKHLLESLNTEFIQVKTIVSAPQARDEVCRQKVEDNQDTISRLEETTSSKLDKREYTHFLESMMKRQREIESKYIPIPSA